MCAVTKSTERASAGSLSHTNQFSAVDTGVVVRARTASSSVVSSGTVTCACWIDSLPMMIRVTFACRAASSRVVSMSRRRRSRSGDNHTPSTTVRPCRAAISGTSCMPLVTW